MTQAERTQHCFRIAFLVSILLCIGQITLFSASAVIGTQRYNDSFFFLLKQLGATGIGIALMALLAFVPVRLYQRAAVGLIVFQIFLIALSLWSPLSHQAQGVRRWLNLGGIRFQPSELAKITVPIYVAYFIARQQTETLKIGRQWLLFSPLLLLMLLIEQQPDLGSTALLFATVLGMFFIAGLRIKYFVGSGLVVCGLITLALFHFDYRRKRLLAFLNPWEDPTGKGFQAVQSFIAFRNGEITGTGLGNSNGKLFFLPEVHTDFIFALVGEELGFIGALGVLLLFCLLVLALFKIAVHTHDIFSRLLCFGLSLSVMLQVLVNLGGVVGLLPVKGLPLPFFSWGRSSLIVTLAILGIVLNILRQSKIMPRKRAAAFD